MTPKKAATASGKADPDFVKALQDTIAGLERAFAEVSQKAAVNINLVARYRKQIEKLEEECTGHMMRVQDLQDLLQQAAADQKKPTITGATSATQELHS